MTDTYRWQRRARVLFGVTIAMALLGPCAALVRGTTAHDWYAAVKLTVTEAMIAVGFNRFDPTRYRAPDGTSFRITRGGLVEYGEPIEARDRILYTAAVGALHGALASVLCVVLFILLWRAANSRIRRRTGWPVRPLDRGPPERLDIPDRFVESANQPLLLAADTAGAAADSAGTEPETAGAIANTDGTSAAPDPEAEKADPEDGGDLNWI